MSKQPLPAPTASTIGPCPTIIQIVGRTGTGSLPRTIAPPDHSRGVLPIWIIVGQGLTVLAVGAGRDCSDIFLSHIISFFFLPRSGMDEWVTCGLSPFQQNFSDIRTLGG